MSLTIFLFSILVSSVNTECGADFKIICYFSSWTGIHPEAKNCTHIVYTFARIEDDNTMTGKPERALCRSNLVRSFSSQACGTIH